MTEASPLVAGLTALLRDDLVGVYLHGSLALGCFNPRRSDVDLLAVTHRPLSPAEKRDIAAFLLDVSGRPYPVEISILAQDDLHPWRYPTPYDLHYSEDWRERTAAELADDSWQEWTAHPEGDPDLAAHITVLRARGRALFGPPIAEVFPLVPCADFLDSLRGDVLDPRFGLSADMPFPVYSVLNACRTLAYLRTGQVLSKAEGGVWALTALPAEHRTVVGAALAAYATPGGQGDCLPGDVAAFAEHMRTLLARELGPGDP